MLDGESKGHLPSRAAWTICLGPGPEMAELAPLLDSLGRGVNQPGSFRVGEIGDVAELMGEIPGGGRLILAGDGFPVEDIGFVRRFLSNNPAWELVIVGRDPGARVARTLLGLSPVGTSAVRWLQLPPDLDQLRELSRVPGRTPNGRADAPAGSGSPIAPESGGPDSGAPGAGEPAAPSDLDGPPAAGASSEPQPVLGDYVGPLADLVQRVDLSFELAEDAQGAPLQLPRDDLGHLRQMTHMMKRVAAPPPPGLEAFDLGELFEEQLASAAIQSPRGLRYLPRGRRGHLALADRPTVSEAIHSLLTLAGGCSGGQGTIEAPYGASDGDTSVYLALEFPAGPLAEADPAGLLLPGAAADRVPGLGAADLPAALAIARSQGGDLRIEAARDRRLLAHLTLPRAAVPTPGAGGPEQADGPQQAEGPPNGLQRADQALPGTNGHA